MFRDDFQKTLIFHTDWNDFVKLWGYFGVAFGVTLGALLAYESNFWGISGSL